MLYHVMSNFLKVDGCIYVIPASLKYLELSNTYSLIGIDIGQYKGAY